MLESFLSRIRGLRAANRVWNVADEGKFLLLALVRNCEIRLARHVGLDFDEVHAAAFEHIDSTAAILWRRGRNRRWKLRLRTIQHWPSHYHSRTNQPSLGDFLARCENQIELAAHVAHAGNSVGDKQRQRDFPSAGYPIAEESVDVHIP